MGPQHDSCGRLNMPADELVAQYLQWGRNMIVAEGSETKGPRTRPSPSMGPQHDSCGRAPVLDLLRHVVGPSMGPQHDSCGRYLQVLRAASQSLLQWGRNMIVAEGRRSCWSFSGRVPLQWGRNMIVAEGCLGDVAGGPFCFPSMGPQHDSCGRSVRGHTLQVAGGPSMGPQHDSCGRPPGSR